MSDEDFEEFTNAVAPSSVAPKVTEISTADEEDEFGEFGGNTNNNSNNSNNNNGNNDDYFPEFVSSGNAGPTEITPQSVGDDDEFEPFDKKSSSNNNNNNNYNFSTINNNPNDDFENVFNEKSVEKENSWIFDRISNTLDFSFPLTMELQAFKSLAKNTSTQTTTTATTKTTTTTAITTEQHNNNNKIDNNKIKNKSKSKKNNKKHKSEEPEPSPTILQQLLFEGLSREIVLYNRGSFFLPKNLQFTKKDLPNRSLQELIETKISIGDILHGLSVRNSPWQRLRSRVKIRQICNNLLKEIDQEIQTRNLN